MILLAVSWMLTVCTDVDAGDCIEYLDIWTIMNGRLEEGAAATSTGRLCSLAMVFFVVSINKEKNLHVVRFAAGHRIREQRAGLSVLTVVYMHKMYAVNATTIRPWWYPENDGQPAASGL